MEEVIFRQILNLSSVGYALNRTIYNDEGKPIDSEFIEVNNEFKSILGIEDKSNYQLEDIIPNLFNNDKNIYTLIEEVTISKQSMKFDFYSYALKINCILTILPVDHNHFTIVVKVANGIEDDFNTLKNVYKIIDNDVAGYIYMLDLNLNFYYLSPQCIKQLGYTNGDIKTLTKKIMPLKSFTEVKNIIADAMKSDKQFHIFELEIKNKKGDKIIVENTISILKDKEKRPIGVIGLARNITEQVIKTEQLRKSQDQIRLILDSTSEGIFGVDLDGNCTFCNNSCLKMLGYKKEEEILHKNIHKMLRHHNIKGELLNREDCNIYKALSEKKASHLVNEILWRKDGTYFYAELFSHPQFSNGEMIGTVVTFFDVTGRKKVEDELRESERSKSVLLSNLPGMAYRCNFDRNWTMQFVSDGCKDLTGYRPENLINNHNLSFNDIISPEYREYLWNTWVYVIQNKKHFREEYTIITKDGELKWVLEQGQGVYNDMGEVEAIEGFITDITVQKRKEEDIRYLSYHDGLTGIYNRIYFEKEKKRLDDKEFLPLTIMIGDINGLKLTNDAFGHDEGDNLIVRTSKLIQEALGEEGVLARTGGDEFAILLPNTDSEQAYKIMKKILKAQEEKNRNTPNSTAYLNFSLGFATKETIDQDLSKIQKLAEEYMYKRKLLERSSLHSSIIKSIKTTMYENSQETEAHAERLQLLVRLIGKKLNLNQVQHDELALLATLHDIGKVGIDKKILNKPGKLTEEEWIEMKKHPEIGYRIAMASPDLMSIAKYILYHHERWDGKGYPQGLSKDEIPLHSRILAVADAYDAMTNDRIYHKAISKEEALAEIKANAGTQFDPQIVECFLLLKDKI